MDAWKAGFAKLVKPEDKQWAERLKPKAGWVALRDRLTRRPAGGRGNGVEDGEDEGENEADFW
jgi:hypothetical protein